jgi:tetratricopeptide (TPR) repeat protein
VYEAFDRQRHLPVALKTLRHVDADALYRFKQEFRSLTDVAHPNLVTLYELLSEGDEWFFTMELVHGVPFNEYVRWNTTIAPARPTEAVGDAVTHTVRIPAGGLSPQAATHLPIGGILDVARLRQALAQVAEAVCAIHEAGILHRDIKPSNVLITSEGRAVLLDFGLVSEVRPASAVRESRIAGTPAYMSPEQISGRVAAAATDWYSFGVMLYEALVGELPFKSDDPDVFTDARHHHLRPPIDRDSSVPADLSELCVDLLMDDPDARPSGAEILRRVSGAAPPGRVAASIVPPGRTDTPFIGREPQLAALRAALDDSRAGKTVIAFVRGRSGMGKTALVQRFLDEARETMPAPVVLTGRCYERESVPFKALDSLVDAFSVHLEGLPRDQVSPPDVSALARLFPVLREVAAPDESTGATPITDSQELRRRAFAAFRALMSALADRGPLVLFIDDLQWGDLDSGALLADLVRPPYAPRLLLVGAYRSEEAETSAFLQTVVPALGQAADTRDVDVGELTQDESIRLALAITRGQNTRAVARARAIAAESGGSPFFIDGLARYADEGGGAVRLEQVIDARVSQLPYAARHLLELAAIAGQPLDLWVATAASTVEGDQAQMLRLLQARRLARTRGTEYPALEIYHDRIRESVAAHIPPDIARLYHQRLAETWEASGRGDPEVVATHYEAAGQADRAVYFAALAALGAEDALAFDRAARLYRWLIDLRGRLSLQGPLPPGPPEETRRLQTKLGHALANAGRGDQAAHAFLSAAAAGASPDEAADLERRAAEQLLRMGKIDEGLAVLRTVLGRVGLKIDRTPAAALLSIAGHRALIGLRGLRFRDRPAGDVPPGILRRLDACWTAAVGLSMVDTVRGTAFQQRNLLLALRAGEPHRAALALAMQIPNTSFAGGARRLRRTERLGQDIIRLAERLDHPHALGLAIMNVGIAYRLHGRYRQSLEHIERGAAIIRERCTGVAWELEGGRIMTLENLLWLGRWKDMFASLPEFLQEAEARGDVYGETYMRVRILPMRWLAQDRPDEARGEAARAIARWSAQGFHLQHYNALFSQVDADLYAGDGAGGCDRLARGGRDLRRSMLMRLQAVRIEFFFLRARATLIAALQDQSSRPRLLRLATSDAAHLDRTRAPWAAGMACVIRAGIASMRGQSRAAEKLLADGERHLDASDLSHVAAACRRRRGELMGGRAGHTLVAAADRWMVEQQVLNPERMANLLAPGASRT